MAPPYIQVPSGDNTSLAAPPTAHMATTTLKVEGMT
jgi:Cu+-exporting ATPase